MTSAAAARARLCDPSAEVSAHYLIARDGAVMPLVDEAQRAWHAGAGEWQGQDDINSRSIGIELDNNGQSPFSAPLMDALDTLLPGIMARWSISASGVIGHSDLAPGRKIDPGPRFDWSRLERQGLAARPHAPARADFSAMARVAGYTAATASETEILNAVRLRLRPHATGPLCEADHSALLTPPTARA